MKIYSSHQLCNLKTRLKDAAKEAGNVLFMILIAVALFAALAYAVTQSTRSGGGDASNETTELQASQMVQYATSIKTAIMRMRLSNGCAINQISFENPKVSGYINPNSPADKSCHVFYPNGGNLAWQDPPQGTNDGNPYSFNGGHDILDIGKPFGGTLADVPLSFDITMILPNINTALCDRIQKKLNGITTGATNTNNLTISGMWTGSFVWYTSGVAGVGCLKPTVGEPSALNKLHFVYPVLIQ